MWIAKGKAADGKAGVRLQGVPRGAGITNSTVTLSEGGNTGHERS